MPHSTRCICCKLSEDLPRFRCAGPASHPDPQPDYYAVSRPRNPDQDGDSGNRPDVPASSINCVRGTAAGAIKAVLFNSPERLDMLQSAIDSLLNDPHAAVRAAGVGLALPLYNIDHKVAVNSFLETCSHPEDGVLLQAV